MANGTECKVDTTFNESILLEQINERQMMLHQYYYNGLFCFSPSISLSLSYALYTQYSAFIVDWL